MSEITDKDTWEAVLREIYTFEQIACVLRNEKFKGTEQSKCEVTLKENGAGFMAHLSYKRLDQSIDWYGHHETSARGAIEALIRRVRALRSLLGQFLLEPGRAMTPHLMEDIMAIARKAEAST